MIFSFPFPPNLSSYQNYNLPQQKINYNNIEDMPLGISQTSFMSELSEKVKSLKFDKINPSPIIINGGNLAPLHVYHQPMWLPSIIRNSNDEYKELQDLELLNQKIDQEIKNRDPFYKNQNDSGLLQQQILIGDLNQINTPEDVQKLSVKHEILGKNSNIFEAIVPRESLPNFKETDPDNSINNKNNDTTILDLKPNEKVEPKSEKIDLNIEQRPQGNLKKILSLIDPPKCSNKRGFIKIREKDMKEKEVPQMYAYLNKNRLTYYLDEKDPSSIQGSIELKIITTPINVIKDSGNCFQIKTVNQIQNCSICAENEKEMANWLEVLTQNIINCN